MSELIHATFQSQTFGELKFPQLVKLIAAYINEEQAIEHRLIIGTDSLPNGQAGRVNFVTAVAIHRVGRGGIYFWCRQKKANIYNLQPRIWQEAWISIELAKDLIEHFDFIPKPGKQIVIHVDIGTNGPTRELIKEIVGMVVGNGFEVKTKPEAYVASKVADRHTINT